MRVLALGLAMIYIYIYISDLTLPALQPFFDSLTRSLFSSCFLTRIISCFTRDLQGPDASEEGKTSMEASSAL